MYVLSKLWTPVSTIVLKQKQLTLRYPARFHGKWFYRQMVGTASKTDERLAVFLGFVFWYWVLYHCWKEPEHLLGEYHPPDASKWTDEELGIPPDDDD